jgi:nucleotide-binding universal stress UspA family protein
LAIRIKGRKKIAIGRSKVMFKRILIPLDGSELAERSLPVALPIAQAQGSELILMRVPLAEKMMTSYPAEYSLLWPEQSLQLSRKMSTDYLQQVLAEHASSGVPIRAMVVDGDVAGGIVDTVEEEQADLIIMTTHGYSGLTRWMLGSITERVLREAHCPVLAIRNGQPLAHLLITLDGSYLAETALAPGFSLAQALKSRVTLLQIVPAKGLLDWGQIEQVDAEKESEIQAEVMDNAYLHLEQLVGSHAPRGLEVKIEVASGSPAATILDYIERHQVDVTVMATHGRTGLRRWVYGSITEKVMRGANCSMLIVRPHFHD